MLLRRMRNGWLLVLRLASKLEILFRVAAVCLQRPAAHVLAAGWLGKLLP
jgi:hypothetical protein